MIGAKVFGIGALAERSDLFFGAFGVRTRARQRADRYTDAGCFRCGVSGSGFAVRCVRLVERSWRRDDANDTPEACAPRIELHGYG